ELGMPENSEYARKLADRLYGGIRRNFFDFSTGYVNGDTQTSCAMALFYGLLETDEEKQKVLDYLLNLIINKDKEHMNVGVLGNKVLFRVLCDNGYTDLALKMVVRPDFPSFGNLLERGATTLWEFHDPEGSKIDSLNHHFWGDISAWFYQYLAGIDINPTAKDITHVNIAPVFPEGLNSVKAEHELVHGKLSVSINRTDKEGSIVIICPDTVHGEMILPDGWHFATGEAKLPLASGKYDIVK
ncbi:MAG: hypothetical protein IJB57_08205, partial [Clostridia bacterium]|nr:hypothetical protein [Clostridia bacterium]